MSVGELAARLRGEGLAPGTWSNGPGDRYAPHEHDYDKVLVCAEGSIRFGLPDRGSRGRPRGRGPPRPPGRAPATTRSWGPDGVTCLEAHVPAGTLAELRRHPAGGW